MEPAVADAFLSAVRRLQNRINEVDLLSAVATGGINSIMAATRSGELGLLLLVSGVQDALQRTALATGQANASVLSEVLGVEFSFRATDPNAILYARQQSSLLVKQIEDDVREAIRIIVAAGQQYGLTVAEQATAIREVVGLPSVWASAPVNFGRELAAGEVSYERLLHDPRLPPAQRRGMRNRVKREIQDAVDSGRNLDPAWRASQVRRYAENLRSRRALNIARTETLQAANFGQRESWRQAQSENVLPQTARRMWVVTPDDRLRETHAEVPGMNPDGVPIDGGVYDTPLGPSGGPPLEVNCRCSEGLVFPGFEGVL